jgi:hypothetical protein
MSRLESVQRRGSSIVFRSEVNASTTPEERKLELARMVLRALEDDSA